MLKTSRVWLDIGTILQERLILFAGTVEKRAVQKQSNFDSGSDIIVYSRASKFVYKSSAWLGYRMTAYFIRHVGGFACSSRPSCCTGLANSACIGSETLWLNHQIPNCCVPEHHRTNRKPNQVFLLVDGQVASLRTTICPPTRLAQENVSGIFRKPRTTTTTNVYDLRTFTEGRRDQGPSPQAL